MAEPHQVLNGLDELAAAAALRRACAAERWVARLLALRPFSSTAKLLESAEREWQALAEPDQLAAFAAHPEIGEDPAELERRFAATATLSQREQAGVREASPSVLCDLAENNRAYRARFGFTFLICASGRSAAEMLAALRERLAHDRATELAVAAAEQAKIMRLRLQGLGG